MNIAVIENNVIAVNSIREKLFRTLTDRGYRVTILTSGAPGHMNTARGKGFNIVDVGSSRQNPLGIARYLFNLRGALKRSRADVCLTFTIRPAIWGNLAAGSLGVPTVTNITGIGPLFARNNVAYRGARALYKFALRKTAKIFFQNNDDRKIFIEKGLADPAVSESIPGSGVDHEHYAPRSRDKAAGNFRFLFISRLVKDKGILEYVEAARMLKNELPGAVFSVLGPVWRQNLKDNTVTETEIAGWVKEGVVEYLGESGDVRGFIAGADCVVLPSYREGCSNVLLEASSMERPCIAADVTGCREIVEDGVTGYLCRVQDAGDLAAGMKRMYRLPVETRAAMGVRAREKVIREFDKKIVIDAYIKAIERILKI